MKKASLASLQVEMGDPPYEERRKNLVPVSSLIQLSILIHFVCIYCIWFNHVNLQSNIIPRNLTSSTISCEVYNSPSHAVKKLLDNIQLQCLRICTGSMKSASLTSLQVEMGEPPLTSCNWVWTRGFCKCHGGVGHSLCEYILSGM
jgi:hypothetical protein